MDRVFHSSLLRKRPHRETRSVPHQALAGKKRTEGFQNGGGERFGSETRGKVGRKMRGKEARTDPISGRL